MNTFKNLLFFVIMALFSWGAHSQDSPTLAVIAFKELPKEAQQTLLLIKRGKPYPYVKDGVVFGNYEGSLPKQKRGYYHEFTVKTPRESGRGARRIVVGGEVVSSDEYYYTDDHYASFKRIKRE